MNIQLDKQDNGTAYLAVTVEPADYEENVVKELKKIRREAHIPGFRPGNVPQNIINKRFRKSVIAELTTKSSYDFALDYVKKNDIKTMGDIIPSERQGKLDFDNSTSFEYCYKVGLTPEFDLNLSSEDVIEKIVLKPTETMFQQSKKAFLDRFSELKDVDEAQSADVLSVTLQNGDMTIEDSDLSLVRLTKEMCDVFVGKKVSDKIDVNIADLYPLTEERARVLSVSEEELTDVNPIFTVEINKVQRFVNPEINEAFFEKAFPDKDITTEEQFNEKINSNLSAELNDAIQWKFNESLKDYVLNKLNVSLPDDFLKEWLFLANEGKFTKETIEKDYPAFQKMMIWGLVRKNVMAENNLEVTDDDIMNQAKSAVLNQYRYYGISEVPEEYLLSAAKELLNNKERAKELYEVALDECAISVIKEKISIVEKVMTADEYSSSMKQDNTQPEEQADDVQSVEPVNDAQPEEPVNDVQSEEPVNE